MLNKVMTLKEASEKWGVSNRTLLAAIVGQKGFPPRFKENESNKSAGTWLVKEEAMMRLYGMNEQQLEEARQSFVNEFGASMVDEYTFVETMKINGEEKTVIQYVGDEIESIYVDGQWLPQIESKVLMSEDESNWIRLAKKAYGVTGEYPSSEDVYTYEHAGDTFIYNDLIAMNVKTEDVYTSNEFEKMIDSWNEQAWLDNTVM